MGGEIEILKNASQDVTPGRLDCCISVRYQQINLERKFSLSDCVIQIHSLRFYELNEFYNFKVSVITIFVSWCEFVALGKIFFANISLRLRIGMLQRVNGFRMAIYFPPR